MRNKEFMYMQRQMHLGPDMTGASQKLELENMKLQFMMEMDKKLKEHLGGRDSMDRYSAKRPNDKKKKNRGRDWDDISEYDSELEETPPRNKKNNNNRSR
jgi:hypothetical protein